MKEKFKKIPLTSGIIILIILLLSTCVDNHSKDISSDNNSFKPDSSFVNYDNFAQTQICMHCHTEITKEYLHTAHYFTSQKANKNSIKGSFENGKNMFIYDENRVVILEKKDSSFYQNYYYKGRKDISRRFNISVGSGTKGQTYLSWFDKKLIELPVSYFTQIHQWANSPGYPLYPTLFNRPATTRCMECHSTYASMLTPPMSEHEIFDSSKMILSVSCEKCHGPAALHVAYEEKHPQDSIGKFIVNPAKLSRELNIEVCALCHAGRLQKTKPSFQFVAGKKLSDYFSIDSSLQNGNENLDVHGNQFGLLAASKCYRLSTTLTCVTCHDSHKNERDKMETFSERCLTCHTQEHSIVQGLPNNELLKNCIDCHMPLQSSKSISFLTAQNIPPVNAMMRTHFIKIYPDETKKYLNEIKKVKR